MYSNDFVLYYKYIIYVYSVVIRTFTYAFYHMGCENENIQKQKIKMNKI